MKVTMINGITIYPEIFTLNHDNLVCVLNLLTF